MDTYIITHTAILYSIHTYRYLYNRYTVTTTPFTGIPGINAGLPRNASPIHYFQLFMTMSIWNYILETTNQYARNCLSNVPPRRQSVFRNWKDISIRHSLVLLMDPLENLCHDLYTDRFYTSPLLAEELLQLGMTLTGTVMSNRKNIPAAVKIVMQKKGDVATYTIQQMVVMQLTDKLTLISLTTKHDNSMISIPPK